MQERPALSKPPRELELKLAVRKDDIPKLLHHPALGPFGGRQAQRRHQVTTYFDTRDRTLAQHGLSLRVRRSDGRLIQTLKADRRGGVAADRAEWEWEIDQDKPDLSLLGPTNAAAGLGNLAGLEQVVRTDIDRTTWQLELDAGTSVEAALDAGVIIAGDASEPVHELELELRTGDAAPVFRLALELHAAAPLTIAQESKGERGFRLDRGSVPAACQAEPVDLRQDASAAEAFRQIVTEGLGHLLVNRAAVVAGDAEGVHQMRVAIRRLRAVLVLYQPLLEPHAAARFEAALRRLGQVFGTARDWDVFCLEILPAASEDPAVAAWRDLLHHPATARREAAHRSVVRELAAPGFTGLVLGLAAWAEQGSANPDLLGHGDALARPVAEACPELLDRLARKVAQRGRHIRRRSDAERHALRKSLKKLRYGIDFVAALDLGHGVQRYLRACKKLQKSLGDINDSVAATALAEELGSDGRPDLAPAVSALAMQLGQRRAAGLQALPRRWRRFRAQPRFWK